MQLRPATIDDAQELADFGRESFAAAFAHLYRPEDLAAFNAESYSPEAVEAEIAGDTCTYRIAEEDGQIVGYCKLRYPSKLAGHSQATNPLELGQLYTDPSMTGTGIGAKLMDWALDVARDGGHDSVLLSVWSGNHRAQKFYERYGFAKIADIHFKVGEQLDEEFLYELPL
ncbi:N-acetyltransferase family protein [Qipengyuania sp. RANM35]|uniref:GNAT family N-acetyltransferase n=1 Tax=Qipengyuania sp. RANM35 TaxID=3068635 RepID=UPI0034DAE9A4